VEKKDLTDNLYYLYIATPDGSAFTSSVTSLDLVGRLISESGNILSEDNCECTWYEKDLSVTVASDNYDKQAGVTWKKIPSSNFDTLTV
jgi:hypothetical protein